MRRLRLLSFLGLLASTLVLSVKVLQPVVIQLVVEGYRIEITQQPAFYVIGDVALIVISSVAFGACLVYLVMRSGEPSKVISMGSKEHWVKTLEGLIDEDERTLFTLLVDGDGVAFQSDLVDLSGFSKSKVSLVLDRLEAKRAVERRRSGMTNVVMITGTNR